MRPDARELGAFVDGELDLPRQLALEALLAQDPRLQAEVAQLRRVRDAVREDGHYHAMPAALKRRLHAAAGRHDMPGSEHEAPAVALVRPSRWRAAPPWATAAALAASLALGSALTWTSWQHDRQVQEAIAGHVRATLSQRLVDVASSDRHTVKPWLSARLDFSPPVHELPGAVFAGGRVDYLDGRPAAALVYRVRAHVIDVFIEPAAAADEPPRLASRRGFNVVEQVRAGMRYWIVSDLNAEELQAFVRSLDAAASAG